MSAKGKSSLLLETYSNHNELVNSKDKSNSETLLLLDGPKENLEILRALNITHQLDIVEKEYNEKNSIKELSNLFDSKVYVGKDIKKLCNLYDLKMCKAEHYKGLLSADLAVTINDFIKKHSYTVKKNEGTENEKEITKSRVMTTTRNFFILAPTESFLNTDKKSKNATLFYREHDEYDIAGKNDKFVEIFSWGSDYSSKRIYRTIFNSYDYKSTKDATIPGINKVYAFAVLVMVLFGTFTNMFLFPVISTVVILFAFYVNNQSTSNILFDKWNEPEL